eukprot:CAMPEP_0196159536 /NCGR_PEP_ID=MMETSP0910-20130528/46372_1 /TAXON_ID=49265 /ORGANISM="Thalassiosira rotula, Strain GSO102" /LENGTH=237 /DNA_ID=CAMNT_0041424457 /DNA_START=93 /DNA_END=806 /DNA_ORIENTATION=+
MGKDDNNHHGNNTHHDANKRQRLDNPLEQRTTFEEDMARIRSAMNSSGGGGNGNNNASSSSDVVGVSETVGGGGVSVDERSSLVPDRRVGMDGEASGADGDDLRRQHRQQHQQHQQLQQQYHQHGLGLTLHELQASEEFTLQQQQQQHQTVRHYYSQQRQAQPHAPGITMGNGERLTGALDSEDEEDGGNHWLRNFTPRSVTRIGENYQVANLPAAPSRDVAPAASSFCVSPGSGGG